MLVALLLTLLMWQDAHRAVIEAIVSETSVVNVKECRMMLERHEGRKRRMYPCPSGHMTIGVGHNLDAKSISNQAVDQIFSDDLDDAEHDVIDVIGCAVWANLSLPRRAALVDMAFQMGGTGFAQFKKTIHLVSARQFEEAAREMLNSTWAKQTPSRAIDISEMIRTGAWCVQERLT